MPTSSGPVCTMRSGGRLDKRNSSISALTWPRNLVSSRLRTLVVTGSRLQAVKYMEAFQRYIGERGYDDIFKRKKYLKYR